jgi:23S rRNA G2445 N2-methylase RlmL
MNFCFEHWPIFNKEDFAQTKEEIFQRLLEYELDPEVDIRVIGSDLKVFKEHVENAEIYKYRYQPNFDRTWNFRDNPLLYSYHYPELNRQHQEQLTDFVESSERAVSHAKQNSLISQDPPFFSFYKGDFEAVGQHLLSVYGSFKDFSIITNVPYGKQVMHPKQSKNFKRKIGKDLVDSKQKYQYSSIQDTFRRFGRLLTQIGPQMDDNVYIVSRKMRFSNPMNFTKLTNVGWDTQMDFVNGGINVNLLKLNSKKVHKNREIINSYLIDE